MDITKYVIIGIIIILVIYFSYGSIFDFTIFSLFNIFDGESDLEAYDNELNINAKSISTDTEIYKSSNNKIQVEFIKDSNDQYPYLETTESSGTLNLKVKHQSGINFNSGSAVLKIYVPKNYSGNLRVDSVSGQIIFEETITAEELEIESTSGEITINESISENLSINTVSGNVFLDSIKSNELSINTISGNINHELGGENFEVEINTVSGRIDVSNAEDVSSSERYFKGTLGNDDHQYRIKTVSGDIKIY